MTEFILLMCVFSLGVISLNYISRNEDLKKANDLNYQRFLQSESAKKHLADLCDEKDNAIQSYKTQIKDNNLLFEIQLDIDLEYAKVNADLNQTISDLQLANKALKARLHHKKMPTKLSWEVDNFQIG